MNEPHEKLVSPISCGDAPPALVGIKVFRNQLAYSSVTWYTSKIFAVNGLLYLGICSRPHGKTPTFLGDIRD